MSLAFVMILPALVVAPGAPDAGLPLPGTAGNDLQDILAKIERATGVPTPSFIPKLYDLEPRDILAMERSLLAKPTRDIPGLLRVVPPGSTENYNGGELRITENWDIDGTVNIVGVRVIFDCLCTITVRGAGTLSITGASSIEHNDNNPLTTPLITGPGLIVIEGTASTKIPITSVSVSLLARGPNNDATLSKVRHTQFSNGRIGLQANNSKALLELNTFSNMGTAFFHIPRGAGFTGAANSTIQNSSFVGNQRGVFYQATSGGGTPGSSGGFTIFNEFRANQFGVLCVGTGDGTGNRPNIHHNNFRNHYAEAYSGFRGVNVDVPPPGPSPGDVNVADGSCNLHDNFFGTGESQFFSTSDTTSNNNAGSPFSNSAPANPLSPQVITTTQTMTLPATLNAPLIVDDGGILTIENGELNVNGHLWGSGTGGELRTSNLVIRNNGQLLIRGSSDDVDGLTIRGAAQRFPLFAIGATNMHAFFWRTNAQSVGWDAADFDHLMTWSSGVLADDTVWTPSLVDSTIRRGAAGAIAIFGNGARSTLEGNTIESVTIVSQAQLGQTTFNDNTVTDAGLGLVGVLTNTLNSNNNDFIDVDIAIEPNTAVTTTSAGDSFDGGFSAMLSVLASPTTITNAMVAQQNLGVINLVAGTFTVSGSTFAYNAYAVVPWADTITVSNSNFRDNYQYSFYSIPDDPLGTGTISPGSVSCTNCWFYRDDDDSRSNGGSGTITVTESLAANTAPDPPWLASVTIAGPGETKSVSGMLTAPAIAREGGRLKVEDTALDGQDRFAIGAKTGGQGNGPTGHVTLRGSTLSNLNFIAINSTSSIIENNAFTSAGELFELTTRGQTIECNRFASVSLPVQWMRQDLGLSDLVFRRNVLQSGGGLDIGLAPRDQSRSTITNNAYIGGTVNDGLVDRFADDEVTMSGNNLLSDTGIGDKGFAPEEQPPRIIAESNWWNSATGPTHSSNAGGTGAKIVTQAQALVPPEVPDFNPFLAAASQPAICAYFRFAPGSPSEVQSATFTDLSVAPSGSPIVKRTWNFGDGSGDIVDTTDDVQAHDFTDGGAYTVTLTVETAGGQTATTSRSITVTHVAPVSSFNPGAIVNELTAVPFTDTSTHPNSPNDDPPTGWTFAWDFNGEGSSTARNPSFRFPDGGSKVVKLRVTDNDGQSHESQKTITVPHVAPVAGFSVTGTSETDTYQLTDASTHPNAPTDGIASRAWSCTDGFTSTAQNPTHKFADGGGYSCTLTVTDNDGQSNAVTKSISVGHVAPNADFTSGTASELQDLAFTDVSTHPNAPTDAPPTGWAYAWTFGDGGTSSQRSPVRNYADGGTYTVQLTATDNDGQSSTVSRSVSISHVAPTAAFSFSPANPELGQTVQFTDGSSHPNAPVDGIASWAWDFGNGQTSTAQNPTTSYTENGNYDARLCVTDDDGLQTCTTIRVPVGNIPPVAAWTHSPTTPTDLETVSFTDQSTDADGTIVSWAWDFGDGSSSSAQNPSHLFGDNGLYTVSLTVTDNLGASTTLSKVIEVLNVGPSASFTYGPNNPQVNDAIQFADTSTDPDGTIVAWAWDFGDGTTSTAQHPVHSYPAGGDYTVSLTVTDDDGAVNAVQVELHVCETGIVLLGLDLLDPLGSAGAPDFSDIHIELCTRIDL